MKEVFNSLGDLATQPDEYLHKLGVIIFWFAAGACVVGGGLYLSFRESGNKKS